MGFVISVGLLLVGYTLLDWGHYVAAGHRVPLWYLISGKGPNADQAAQQWATAHPIDQGLPAALGNSVAGAQTQIGNSATTAANAIADALGLPHINPQPPGLTAAQQAAQDRNAARLHQQGVV